MDVVGDALNAIKMAVRRGNRYGDVKANNMVVAIVQLLKREGFVEGYIEKFVKGQKVLRVFIKYTDVLGAFPGQKQALLQGVKRVSRLGKRVYASSINLGGFNYRKGFAIVSTNKGVLSSIRAMRLGIGGEVVCVVW